MLSEFKDGKDLLVLVPFLNCDIHNSLLTTSYFFSTLAAELVNKIMVERQPWSDLFKKGDFFTRYNHYIQIIASSDSEERHLRWSGLVESRIRRLVMFLERVDNVVLAHPYIKGFDKVIQYRTAVEKEDAAHGTLKPRSDAQSEPPANALEEPGTIYTSTFYIGLCIAHREGESQKLIIVHGILLGVR